MNKKEKISIYIDANVRLKLLETATNNGVTLSDHINTILTNYVFQTLPACEPTDTEKEIIALSIKDSSPTIPHDEINWD